MQIEDILGRDEAKPDENLLRSSIENRTILITGAGGTIGFELAKQVVQRKPKKVILLDISEISLYKISKELKYLSINLDNIKLVMGSL